MNADIRRKLEMAARVREFTRARAATDPGFGAVLAGLDALLERAEAIAARQHTGRVGARGARAAREALRRRLHAQLVPYLVAVGSLAGPERPDLAAPFRLPATNASTSVFLTAVKALCAAGDAQRERLVAAGMAPGLLDDLGSMVRAFEAASEAQRTARRDHIGATTELRVVTAQLARQIRLVDGVTRYRCGDDPDVMGEWKAAKQVLGQGVRGDPQRDPGGAGLQDVASSPLLARFA